MHRDMMAFVDRRRVADVSLRPAGGEPVVLAQDAAMNLVGRHFVILAQGREVFRHPHRALEAYFLMSMNGMDFIFDDREGRKTLTVHFVQDVKTPRNVAPRPRP